MDTNDDEFTAISCSSFYGRRFKRLGTALDYIASSDVQADIVLIPPNVDPQTDEEDIDDDEITDTGRDGSFPHDVPGEVEIHPHESDSDETDDDIPLAHLQQKQKVEQDTPLNKKRKTQISQPKWSNDNIDLTMPATSGAQDRLDIVKRELEHLDPVRVFEAIFDDEVINHIVTQTNLYSSQKNDHQFCVTQPDIKLFIAILLFSGYHKVPRQRLYWSLEEDTSVSFVSNAISRNRFEDIKKYLHLADNNNLDVTDKMAKLRPLMTLLNQRFLQWGIFHQELSIDEAMVRYYGHHSAKQFQKGKPARFGYKDWMLTSSTGYCYTFDTYCGAKYKPETQEASKLPLGSSVVLDLLESIAVPSDHIIFFDNYFTSYDLLQTLREKGFRATGTIRENRTRKCPISNNNIFKKKERGYFEYKYSDSNLLFVRWKDNSVVTLATNYDAAEPARKVKRWSTAQKDKVDVPQPYLFQNYNKHMGGVDLLDQTVSCYRINIRGKKWWWSLFTHIINVAAVNAWRLFGLANPGVDLLEFQRAIVRFYVKCYGKSQIITLKQRPVGSASDDVRHHEGGHFPEKLEKQLRCIQCHLRARWRCRKCKVTLCLERECFVIYHS